MKTITTLFAAGAFLVAATSGLAIPDTFGLIGNNVGQEIEKVIEEPSTWEAADLPGEWKKVDGKTFERLQEAARVFGLLAASVDAKKNDDGLSALQLRYNRDSAKDVKGKTLFEALLFNIEAFSGKQPERNGQTVIFTSDDLVITAQDQGRNEAVVTLTRPT